MSCVSWASMTVFLVLSISRYGDAEAGATSKLGSLCVLAHVKRADVRMQSPDVPSAAEQYEIRLDGGNWVSLSSKTSVLLAGIPLPGRHKVVIRGDGRPFSAFTFTFAELGVSHGCLSQSGLYLTWRFHPSAESFAGCRCTGIEPAAWAASAPGIR